MAYEVIAFTSRSVHPLAFMVRVKFDCWFRMSYHCSMMVRGLPRRKL